MYFLLPRKTQGKMWDSKKLRLSFKIKRKKKNPKMSVFWISGKTWGRIWPSEDSIFSWNRETHPSVLQIFPKQIPLPATRFLSALSWPRAHGETWALPHLNHCLAYKILHSEGLQQIKCCICICRERTFRKIHHRAPTLTTYGANLKSSQAGCCVCLKRFLFLEGFGATVSDPADWFFDHSPAVAPARRPKR